MEPCVICPHTAHTRLTSLQQELFLSQSLLLKPRLHRLMMQVELDFPQVTSSTPSSRSSVTSWLSPAALVVLHSVVWPFWSYILQWFLPLITPWTFFYFSWIFIYIFFFFTVYGNFSLCVKASRGSREVNIWHIWASTIKSVFVSVSTRI